MAIIRSIRKKMRQHSGFKLKMVLDFIEKLVVVGRFLNFIVQFLSSPVPVNKKTKDAVLQG